MSLPAAVAAAAGGFLLGVVTFLPCGCCAGRKAPALRLGGGGAKKSEVAALRSFLVDIHLLKDR